MRAHFADTTAPRYFVWSAAAIPVLILSGFALMATIPVAVLAIAALRDGRVAGLRPGIALIVGLHTGPFIDWLFRADPSASLTSLLHPAMAALIALAALSLLAMVFRAKTLGRA